MRTHRPHLSGLLGGACRKPPPSPLPRIRAVSCATTSRSVGPALPRLVLPRELRVPRFAVAPVVQNYPIALRRGLATERYREKGGATNKKGEGTAGKYVYTMHEVTKFIGHDRPLFKDVTLSFFEGYRSELMRLLTTHRAKIGSGKSTLMKIIAGIDTEFDGEAAPVGGAKIGYLAQEPELDPEKTVLENVMDGVADKTALVERYHEVKKELEANPNDAALLKENRTLERRIEIEKLLDLPRRIDRAMEALRCPPSDSPVTNLSGGERRRVALCRLLVSQPDVLLLDEPTNHLDAESVAWLERFLQEYRGAVIAVTHDRYFLDNVAGWILELDRGQALPFKGNYTAWMDAKERRLNLEKRRDAALQKALKAELEWIRAAPRARQAKSKARVNAYDQRVKEAESYKHPEPGTIVIPKGPRLGRVVIEVSNLTKVVEDRVLFKDVSFSIERGAIVGVIGPNGSGKTTLFNIIAGFDQPDSGSVRIGDTVQLGFVSQARSELDPERTVWEEISDGQEEIDMGNGTTSSSRSYCAAFNFKGEQQNQLVGQCSGGERNRVHLAKMLKQAPNVLFLDEPTNDLDVEVLRNLENALQDFIGTAVVISHDRWFLDRLCTHIIAFEGDSRVVAFNGNYSEYEEDRAQRLGSRFDPHRVQYKKLGM